MADISKITLPSGVTYDIKDAVARKAVAGGVKYAGVTTTALTDGSEVTQIVINGETVNAENGMLAIYQKKEFIYATADNKWHEMGDMSDLGAFAFVDTGDVNFTGTQTDEVLGSGTEFTAQSSAVTFANGADDNVLGEATTFTNAPSAVSFEQHVTSTCLTSSVTATVPKTAGNVKYLNTSTTLGTEASTQGADTVMWGASVANETLSFSFKPISTTLSSSDSTSTGAVAYVQEIGTSGTDSVTFDTTGDHTAVVIKTLGAATAAAQVITVGDNDRVAAITDIGTGTAAAQTITAGSQDLVETITALGTGTATPHTS